MIPLVWVGEVPGNEVEHPMAVVLMGGLVTATLLNLFVVPVLYLMFGWSRSGVTAAVGDAQRARPSSPSTRAWSPASL